MNACPKCGAALMPGCECSFTCASSAGIPGEFYDGRDCLRRQLAQRDAVIAELKARLATVEPLYNDLIMRVASKFDETRHQTAARYIDAGEITSMDTCTDRERNPMSIPRNTRFILTLLVTIWVGALVENYMPDRWEDRPIMPVPTKWWAIPYLVTQLTGACCTIAKLIEISEEKGTQ